MTDGLDKWYNLIDFNSTHFLIAYVNYSHKLSEFTKGLSMDIRYLWVYTAPLKELNVLIPSRENITLRKEGWYRGVSRMFLLTETNVPNCNGDALYFLYEYPSQSSRRRIREVAELPLFDSRDTI